MLLLGQLASACSADGGADGAGAAGTTTPPGQSGAAGAVSSGGAASPIGGSSSGNTANAGAHAAGTPSSAGGSLATAGSSGSTNLAGNTGAAGTPAAGVGNGGGNSGGASGAPGSGGSTAGTPMAGAGGSSTAGRANNGGTTSSAGTMSTAGMVSTAGNVSTAGASGTTTVGGNCTGNGTVNTGLVGWATLNGGTTGGKGGTRVVVTTGVELVNALKAKQDSTTPLTIVVNGTITPANSGGVEKFDVKDVQDVSIIGAGAGAEFNGIGIKVVKASNIILRNLKIHHVGIGDKDAISIEGPASNIWVDHCELYSTYQGVDKDFYDGLLDAKAETEYLTYSWNYFHDSWKTSLVGSSEGDVFDRKLTMHHNYFKNCNSRLPLFRGGTAHIFNNYYQDIVETAINSRIGACIQIENNYFSNVQNPWVSAFSADKGGGEIICNMLANGSQFTYSDANEIYELPACTLTVPYNYSSALNAVDQVPAIVMANAGVGKLANPEMF